MTLSERMVEAAAIARYARFRASMAKAGYTLPPWEGLPSEQQASALEDARAALTAALAVAEAEGAGVFVVPANKGADFHKPTDDWAFYPKGWNACRAATLAGRVTL